MGQAPSTYTEHSERGDLRRDFLKTHRPEREAKWILDRSAVGEALMYQADEMMKLEGISSDEIYEGNRRSDFQRSDSGVLLGTTSSVVSNIFSDTTTATDATLPMGNIKRYQPRANASNEINPYGDESDDDDLVVRPIANGMTPPTGNLSQFPTAERKDGIFGMYSKIVSACAQPKEEWQLRREELMTVLHLRMRAHLGRYYLNRFLPMFPRFGGSTVVDPSRPRQHDPKDTGGSDGLTFNASGPASPLTIIYHSTTSAPFMDLGFTGSLNLVSRPTPSSRAHPIESNQKNPDHYIVLVNRRSGVPIAVCARKIDGSGRPPVVRIYATKRRVFGQLAAASTGNLGLDWSGNLPLYPWAEIVTETMYPNPLTFSIYMSAGSDGRFAAKPSYDAHLSMDPEPIIKLSGKTDADRQASGSALISLQVLDEEDGRSKVHLSIDVAQGIDPTLVLCFAAVLDEILEVSMFLQCQARSAH